MKYTNLIIIALLLIAQIQFTQQTDIVQCLDKDGSPVDWWVMLKMPKSYNSGKQYYYFDVDSSDLTQYDDIGSANSPLFRTLAQIEDYGSDNNFSVLWNDQPDGINVSSTYAHSKGIIGGNSADNGFIINHSTPKFPKLNTSSKKIILEMSSDQQIYAQHYFCMSMDFSVLNKYSANMQINRPYVYHSHIPDSFTKQLNELVQLSQNKQKVEDYTTSTLKTLDGQNIVQFAKSGKYNSDLYFDIVAPSYGKSFYFETWGRSLMSATCGTDIDVVSNLAIKFSDTVSYSYTNDHSKYGISVTGYTVCFGDINRMTSQFKRGGGTNCFAQQKLHNILLKAFVEQQDCEKFVLKNGESDQDILNNYKSNTIDNQGQKKSQGLQGGFNSILKNIKSFFQDIQE